MLARGAASEIAPGNQDRRSREARIVERVVRFRSVLPESLVAEQILAQPVERYAAQKARRNDAIGVDVLAADGYGSPRDLLNFRQCHDVSSYPRSSCWSPTESLVVRGI